MDDRSTGEFVEQLTEHEDAQGQRAAMTEQRDSRKLREEIAETREAVGETVQSLADKSDFSARAPQRGGELRRTASTAAGAARGRLPVVAGAVLAGGVLAAGLARSRR